ncbi:MAG: DUF2232 domain-containing protein [Clostridia bacterium]|nr:DUF2232 domain-containing protein [Clostridia bacterium]
MNQETSSASAAKQEQKHPTPKPLYQIPILLRVLLLLFIVIGAVLTACAQAFPLSAILYSAAACGIFAFYYMLTFSPAVVFTVVPAFIIAYFVTGSISDAASVLLFLPAGAVLSLCMLKRKNKSTAVLAVGAAFGITVFVFFLIRYMAQHGTIAPAALLESFNTGFEAVRTELLSMVKALAQNAILKDSAYAEYYTDAYITSVTNAIVDSAKLSIPAIAIVVCECIGYLCVSLYQLLVKLFRCSVLLPRAYRITMTRFSGVLFMIAYFINMFSGTKNLSLFQITAGNLAAILMPGLFLMGLRSLARRAKSPLRRRSFIITAVVLVLLVFSYPPYAILFVILDGLGEVFFGEKMLF